MSATRVLLNTTDAAAYVGASESSLNKWRIYGTGPRFLKIGSRVKYDLDELNRWLASRERATTAERVPALASA